MNIEYQYDKVKDKSDTLKKKIIILAYFQCKIKLLKNAHDSLFETKGQ